MFSDVFVFDGSTLEFTSDSLLTTGMDILLVAAAAGLVVFIASWGVVKVIGMVLRQPRDGRH